MTCGEGPNASLWIAGLLEDGAKEAFLAHLPACETCRRAAREDLLVADALIFQGATARPRPRVKARLLAGARMTPDRAAPWAVAAALLLFLLGIAVGRQVLAPRGERSYFTSELRPLGPGERSRAEAVMMPGDRRMIVVAQNLPALPPGRVFHLWLQTPSGRVLVGTLATDGAGHGWYVGGLPGIPYDAVLISVDRPGGAGPTILRGGVPGS